MTKHQPEAERRAQILRSARSVFIEKGFVAARVEDVARRAGLSKGAVYFYFSSKRDLFMALVREEHDATYAFLKAADRDPRSAEIKMLDLGQRYLGYFAGLKSPPKFFLMMREMGVRDSEIREECQAIHQRFVDAATRIIAQGIAENIFRPIDPVSVAQLLKAMIDGLAGQAAIGVRAEPERLRTDGLLILMHGLLMPPDAPLPTPEEAS